MKTKTAEEILSEYVPDASNEYGHEAHTKMVCKKAMQEYAEQQAVEFAEWISENKYYSDLNNSFWFQVQFGITVNKTSTKELYKQFKNRKR